MNRQELEQKLDEYILANRGQIVDDMAAVIAHKSVEGEAAPGAPFGKEVRESLDEILGIAQRMGLATDTGDGYVGWAELPGEKKEYLATVTHMDVVPEGDGWNTDPYTLVEKDGWLLGRGVKDDRGPGILCLHALNFFKELGETLPYTMRALFGCNEESGMGDVPYYLQHNEAPVFAFSPDADFPVCNGEKGHFGGTFVSKPLDGAIVEFAGGYANNVIPDKASCVLKTDKALAGNEWVRVTREGDALRLDAVGKGGHASRPEGTVNAIGKLVEYLLTSDVCTEDEACFLALLYKLHTAPDGSALGVACRDDVFDRLTIIGGVAYMKDGRLHQTMDSRYPTAITGEEMAKTLGELAAQHNAALTDLRIDEPFFIPADSEAIQALLGTYNEVEGEEAEPFTMGGGTYARHFPKAVSFGPEDPNEQPPDFVGTIHGPNEGAELKSMLAALKIYILSLWKLQQLNLG